MFTDFPNNSLNSYICWCSIQQCLNQTTKTRHFPLFVITMSSLSIFSLSLNRRGWLRAAGWMGVSGSVGAQSTGATLPAAQSLPDELARAIRNKQPLIVMVSLDGCAFCRIARQSHLSPMQRAGRVIVQVDMRNNQPVLDFAGKLTTHDELTRRWKVSITPTLLFFGPGGKEVAELMEGAYLPDFYGPYLEERMATGRKAL
jgi:thioredoxin-related protein